MAQRAGRTPPAIALDTSVFVSHLKGDVHAEGVDEALMKIKGGGMAVHMSFIVYSELWAGVVLSEDPKKEERRLYQLLNSVGVKITGANVSIARSAGEAFAKYRREGGRRRYMIPDFLIGAHANYYTRAILTTNPRNFLRYFEGLEVLTPAEFNRRHSDTPTHIVAQARSPDISLAGRMMRRGKGDAV